MSYKANWNNWPSVHLLPGMSATLVKGATGRYKAVGGMGQAFVQNLACFTSGTLFSKLRNNNK